MSVIKLPITRTEEDWFAIELPVSFLQNALALFRKNCLRAEEYLEKKALRDGAHRFCVTVITPPELAVLSRTGRSPANYSHLWFSLSVKGLGCIASEDTEVYFAVVDSPDIHAFRASYGLNSAFCPHCTLGFSSSDIHDQPKDKVLWKL
jgi:hypothetical protein